MAKKNQFIYSLIKTSCGRDKYQFLASKKGLLSKLRLTWYIFFATIKDWNIRNSN